MILSCDKMFWIQPYVIKVCEWLAAQWLLDSSSNKTDHHEKAWILLKDALTTLNPNHPHIFCTCETLVMSFIKSISFWHTDKLFFSLTGFSVDQWLTDRDLKHTKILPKFVVSQMMEYLDLSSYLQDTSCNRKVAPWGPNYDGWMRGKIDLNYFSISPLRN